MDTKNKSIDASKDIMINILKNLKSNFIFRKIYDNINKKNLLEIIKYNKKLQTRLNITFNDYKEYSENYSSIVVEIKPAKNSYFGKFINIRENEEYYHIFFNDNNNEIKYTYSISEEDKITKIKIIIDYQIKSFQYLFLGCDGIESITFKKFCRTNIKYIK